jgi:hypothetical protein
MCYKEALALYCTLQSVIHLLWDHRVDVLVDNRGLVDAWDGLRGSSVALVSVLKNVFFLSLEFNTAISLTWVPSKANPADALSRALSRRDAMLHSLLRAKLWRALGPFSFDLMALGSNSFSSSTFGPLPFFSESHCPGFSGLNVFAQPPLAGSLYVFPPFVMVPALLWLFIEWGSVEVVMVVPIFRHSSPWLPLLQRFSCSSLPLFDAGASRVLCYPSKKGYAPNYLPTCFGLSAFLCRFPVSGVSSKLIEAPSVSVLVVADSKLKCLQGFSWPHPFSVKLFCTGGQHLMDTLCKMYGLIAHSQPMICIIHSGVNNLSSDCGELSIQAAANMIRSAAPKFCGGSKEIFLAIAQTRDAEQNALVSKANSLLFSMCGTLGWHFQNNDFILQQDLGANVHLGVSGAVKIHHALSHSLREVLGTSFKIHV